MGLGEIIMNGMNNPECAFFVGAWSGSRAMVENLVLIFFVYYAFKIFNVWLIEPAIEHIRKKRKKGS